MAKVVLGLGTSQSPLLSIEPADWSDLAKADEPRRLARADGAYVTYSEALAAAGDRYADIRDKFAGISQRAQEAVQRLSAAVAKAKPDLVVLIADDQRELFTHATLPALAVLREPVLSNPLSDKPDDPPWRRAITRNTALSPERKYPGDTAFADHLIERLIEKHFDVGVAQNPDNPSKNGLGHAWAFVINRLFGDRAIPVVPVLLNTWYPPNVPTPARSFDIGVALREAIDEHPSDLRVAVIASGGLSHYLPNEELDRSVLAGVTARDREALAHLPRSWLASGSGQVLDWILLSGAMAGLRHQWTEYLPTYRTVAGTGIGLAFALWEP